MSQAKQTPKIETIAEKRIWKAIADPVIDLAHGEAVLEFEPDRLVVRVKDAANVALVRQVVPADAFDYYEVDEPYQSGLDFRKIDDLLKVVDADLVSFGWDWDTFAWSFEADYVDGDISGIDPDTVNGSPVEVPPAKDEYDYSVDVTLPTNKLSKASKVVDMATDHITFRMGGEDGVFVLSGKGDTDAYSVDVHDDDAFDWREDPPGPIAETIQSNDYLQEIVGLLDEDTVRFVNGPELPYHLWTTRAGCIDTKIMQAPRIVSK